MIRGQANQMKKLDERVKDLEKKSKEFPYKIACKWLIVLETIALIVWSIYHCIRDFTAETSTYPRAALGFLVLCYCVVFMTVGIQMNYRLKTHFSTEIY